MTLREYVTVVPTLSEALRIAVTKRCRRRAEGMLVDPHASVEEVHDMLERLESALTSLKEFEDPAPRVYRNVSEIQKKLGLPTYMQ